MKIISTIQLFLFIGLFLCAHEIMAQVVVNSWQTAGNKSALFDPQPPVTFTEGTGKNRTKIRLDEDTYYQSVEGFGWTMTQGSAQVIKGLSEEQQDKLLRDLFDKEQGVGSEIIRIGIGATDLSERSYSYHENPNDRSLDDFSLDGPDLEDLIPILKKALLINPDIKILATPWTPPKWMKTIESYIGGELKEYEAYARYFIRYFEEMKKHGITIWAVSPQNEPHHDGNEPSMYMSKEQQVLFINDYLGPAIRNSEFKDILILAWDHNCDEPDYAIYVCNNSSYVDGAAFHLYGGDISAMTTVKNETGKNIYFTEQYTGKDGNFGDDFHWHMQNVMIGSMNNWAKITLEWNLATDALYGPRTPQGCTSCLGALTIDGGNINREVSYYLIAQLSKITKAGAVRIGSNTENNTDLIHTAFRNPDGTNSIVVYNTSNRTQSFDIIWRDKAVSYTLPGRSAGSLLWDAEDIIIPVTDIALNQSSVELTSGETLRLSANVFPENATIKTVRWFSDNEKIVQIDESGVIRAIKPGSAVITAVSEEGNKIDKCEVNVNTISLATDFSDIYTITSLYSDRSLDVADWSILENAPIQQWEVEDEGGDNQRWLFHKNNAGHFFIQSKFSELYLSALNTTMENGVGLVQKTYNGDATQQWNINQLNDLSYTIENVYNEKVVDVSGPSRENGAKIHLWENYLNDNQKWHIRKVENNLTGLSYGTTHSNYLIYPNPTKGPFYVQSDNTYEKLLSLYSASGQLMLTQQLCQMLEEVNISGMDNCMYIVKIEDKEDTVYSKIIKN